MSNRPRILFLDDDPERAEVFLAEHPEGVWVQTAQRCMALLEESWDEVHLDHDLGGQRHVDHERDDCGMAVVRWLCLQARPHLLATRFYIHTHNPNAACMMTLHLESMGFQVQASPFRPVAARRYPARVLHGDRRPVSHRILMWLRRLGGH